MMFNHKNLIVKNSNQFLHGKISLNLFLGLFTADSPAFVAYAVFPFALYLKDIFLSAC